MLRDRYALVGLSTLALEFELVLTWPDVLLDQDVLFRAVRAGEAGKEWRRPGLSFDGAR